MHLSVGIFELVLPAVLGLVSLLLRWRRSKLLQTAEIAFACSCGATLLSPADLASPSRSFCVSNLAPVLRSR